MLLGSCVFSWVTFGLGNVVVAEWWWVFDYCNVGALDFDYAWKLLYRFKY